MTPTVLAVLAFGILACCLADPVPSNDIKWCTTSVPENNKCVEFKNAAKDCKLNCVQKSNIHDCIKSISDSEADAITLDGGHVYDAGLQPYNLKPIMSEDYGTVDEKDTCYFAVAVAKKNTRFTFAELKGKKSCHTGLGKTAGWNVPIGTLVELGFLPWDKVDPIEKAVSKFFDESCVPGAKNHPNLCSLCKGQGASKCTLSDDEPYNGYSGAYKCLADGAGDVAFVKHSTVPAGEAEGYELLCLDNTRKPISEYASCNLARVPAHAVVTRSLGDKTEAIRQCLTTAQEIFGKKTPGSFHLFSSSYGKDLLFKDSAKKLLPLPNMDAALYLGAEYNHAIRGLKQSSDPSPTKRSVRWCTLKKDEKQKCDEWSLISGDAIRCGEGASTDDCIAKIQKGDMDAVTLDGGFVYTAGKCGLVPVMGEYYDTDDLTPCTGRKTNVKGKYYAVAIVKASNKKITWETMQGKTSCHTAVGRTAGFIIPVGLIQQQNKIKDCKIGEFFSKSCAPGSDPSSNLCDLCIGSPGFKDSKCQPNSKELYYGYSGAFRCMVEGGGDVAFAKHTTTFENTDGNNPANWAKDLKSTDFELMCLDGTRAPVTEYKKCHLAEVPAHAVMTRPEKRDEVVQILTDQQSLYGRTGTEKDIYQMFVSGESKDLLFKDSTQCLIEVPSGTSTKDFLGQEYSNAVAGMTACSSPSELLKACTFHSCS